MDNRSYRAILYHTIPTYTGPITYTSLLPYDQHHYYGTQDVDFAIQHLHLLNQHRVINIGSGLGGPSRYIAGKIGCQVCLAMPCYVTSETM